MAITFGAYTKKREDTALNAFLTGLGDTSASLLIGVAVFCTVFAFSNDPEGTVAQAGAGMTFIQLPVLFAKMPGGNFLALLFFLAMAFAALTSMITTLEISTKNFEDLGFERKRSILMISAVTFILGVPSGLIVFNFTTGGETYPVTAFLDNQDTVWGTGLLLSGLFITFLVWKYGVRRFRRDFINSNKWNDIKIGPWYDIILYVFFPIIIFVLLIWYSFKTFLGESDTWWESGPIGLMLIFGQWAVIIIILLLANKWMADRIPEERLQPPNDGSDDGPSKAAGQHSPDRD